MRHTSTPPSVRTTTPPADVRSTVPGMLVGRPRVGGLSVPRSIRSNGASRGGVRRVRRARTVGVPPPQAHRRAVDAGVRRRPRGEPERRLAAQGRRLHEPLVSVAAGPAPDAGAPRVRAGEPHHRLQQRQRAGAQPRLPPAGGDGSLGRERTPACEGLTGVRTAWSTGDASFYSRDGTATFAVLEFDGTSEEVQAQIPALRRALKPTRLDDPSDRRSRRVRGARAALRRGPAQGGELHDPRGDPRARAHLRDAGRRRPAGDRRRHGRDRHPGHLLGARPGPGHLRVRDERRDAARPGRGHRLRAVHGRAVSRGARRGSGGGRGGRDDGRHRRPLHLLQRDHRRRRACSGS